MSNTINENTKNDTYLVVDGKLKDSNNKISYITNLKPYLQKLLRAEGEENISDNFENIIRLANKHNYTIYKLEKLDFPINKC